MAPKRRDNDLVPRRGRSAQVPVGCGCFGVPLAAATGTGIGGTDAPPHSVSSRGACFDARSLMALMIQIRNGGHGHATCRRKSRRLLPSTATKYCERRAPAAVNLSPRQMDVRQMVGEVVQGRSRAGDAGEIVAAGEDLGHLTALARRACCVRAVGISCSSRLSSADEPHGERPYQRPAGSRAGRLAPHERAVGCDCLCRAAIRSDRRPASMREQGHPIGRPRACEGGKRRATSIAPSARTPTESCRSGSSKSQARTAGTACATHRSDAAFVRSAIEHIPDPTRKTSSSSISAPGKAERSWWLRSTRSGECSGSSFRQNSVPLQPRI